MLQQHRFLPLDFIGFVGACDLCSIFQSDVTQRRNGGGIQMHATQICPVEDPQPEVRQICVCEKTTSSFLRGEFDLVARTFYT